MGWGWRSIATCLASARYDFCGAISGVIIDNVCMHSLFISQLLIATKTYSSWTRHFYWPAMGEHKCGQEARSRPVRSPFRCIMCAIIIVCDHNSNNSNHHHQPARHFHYHIYRARYRTEKTQCMAVIMKTWLRRRKLSVKWYHSARHSISSQSDTITAYEVA